MTTPQQAKRRKTTRSYSSNSPMTDIQIRKEPIELLKLLKFAGVVGTGGEAKIVISEGMVKVNGEVETRKRKQIASGDEVEYQGETFKVSLT